MCLSLRLGSEITEMDLTDPCTEESYEPRGGAAVHRQGVREHTPADVGGEGMGKK